MHHLGKIPNMPYQGFTAGLFHREVLPGRTSLGLHCQVTMVCASSTANCGTMVPFLVEMCIFAFPTTFATSVFLGGRRGQNRCFFVKGHQGQCAKYHHSNFDGWGTYQGCHIQEVRNYLGLLPYNELFLP
jgi:hypothetical protein